MEQPEDAGSSAPEPDAADVDGSVVQQGGAFDAGDGGDEWHVVGKCRRTTSRDEVRTCLDFLLPRILLSSQRASLCVILISYKRHWLRLCLLTV